MKLFIELDVSLEKTTNGSSYNLSVKRRGSLSIWFDAGMDWQAKPSDRQNAHQS